MEKKCVECFERFEWSNVCPRCSSRNTVAISQAPERREVDWDSLQSCCTPQTVACGGQTVEMVDGSTKWSDSADELDAVRYQMVTNADELKRLKEYWEDDSE